MSDPAILFDSVRKRYGAVRALDGLSFDVPPGQMFGLIGPDGAGKTTTIRVLCGLLHAMPDASGCSDTTRSQTTRAVTRAVGYLSQRFSLYGDLSIDENIAFFAEIHGLRGYEARRDRLLDLTQLTAFRSRLADRLSARHEAEAGARLHARPRATGDRAR